MVPPYVIGLTVASLLVAGLEVLRPWRPAQRRLRRWLWSDLIHLVFNGHFLGVLIYMASTEYLIPPIDAALQRADVHEIVYLGVAASWPTWAQIVVVIVAMDFVQWCVHRLLHGVPWLWEFHKAHHSVVDGEMDWIVSFRFHWMEVVVYKTIQYVPLAMLGVGGTAVLTHAIFGTLIGHLNHSNLDLGHGWWRYVLNSPRMHIWHHDYDARPGETKNFGIIFSAWDWIFGTAYTPDKEPRKLGYPGVEVFPHSFFGHTIWPLQKFWSPSRKREGLGEGSAATRPEVIRPPPAPSRKREGDTNPAAPGDPPG